MALVVLRLGLALIFLLQKLLPGWIRFVVPAALLIGLWAGPCFAQSKTAPQAAKKFFRQLCQRCHAADGKGETGTAGVPDFTRGAWHETRSDARLVASILEGKGTGMPAFRGRLSQDQAKELVAHIRAFAPNGKRRESATSAAQDDFDRQWRQLEREMRDLRRQFKELAGPDPVPAKPKKSGATNLPGGEAKRDDLRAAGRLFRRHCQCCHGADGKGADDMLNTPGLPDFSRRAWQDEHSDGRLLRAILDGKKKEMPAFREKLGEEKARDLVRYIRTFTPMRR